MNKLLYFINSTIANNDLFFKKQIMDSKNYNKVCSLCEMIAIKTGYDKIDKVTTMHKG